MNFVSESQMRYTIKEIETVDLPESLLHASLLLSKAQKRTITVTLPTTHQRKHSKLQSTYELKLTPCIAVKCDLLSNYIVNVENLQTLR